MTKAPIFHQRRLGAAAAACGWLVRGPILLFDMNMADLNLVNDHPIFRQEYLYRFPKSIVLMARYTLGTPWNSTKAL